VRHLGDPAEAAQNVPTRDTALDFFNFIFFKKKLEPFLKLERTLFKKI
jgi:hypothetical protein